MTDTPSISAAFRASSDPAELRPVVVELARAIDHAVAVDKVHWTKINALEEDIKRLDGAIERLGEQFVEILRRLERLETRMAIYAAIGAFAGGSIVALAMKLLFK